MNTVLTIAGFDPSGGAGLLADMRAFAHAGVKAAAACTAVTFQNEKKFSGVRWIAAEDVLAQIRAAGETTCVTHVKIGLIESWETLRSVIHCLKQLNPSSVIIWDPICSASAGFTFHDKIDRSALEKICAPVFMLTPNRDEIRVLCPGAEPEKAASELSQFCHVLLKGGHREGTRSTDILFSKGKQQAFTAKRIPGASLHGSGCILSAAITAGLALGKTPARACSEAKEHVLSLMKNRETETA